MTDRIRLDDRVVLSVDGPDAESFLNGLLTNSTTDMSPGEARHGALLTPQGKILCEIVYLRTDGGFLLDVPDSADASLLKRLKMFKLRADVVIELKEDLAVYAFVTDGFDDPRSPDLPKRAFEEPHRADKVSAHAWRAARIAAGVAQQGYDFSENEVFPADINLDVINGVDFKKGCFVGQEVVSRMKRRGTARRRTLVLHIPEGAPHSETPVEIGETKIGAITSSEDNYALVRVRIDRMAKAMEDPDAQITVGGRAAKLVEPEWLAAELEALNGD